MQGHLSWDPIRLVASLRRFCKRDISCSSKYGDLNPKCRTHIWKIRTIIWSNLAHFHTRPCTFPSWKSFNWLMIPTGFYCIQRLRNIFSDIYCKYFRHKTVSSTEENNKKNWQRRQNFHFHLNFRLPFNSAENWFLGKPANPQRTSDWKLILLNESFRNFHFLKITQSPSTPPTPSRLHLPGYSPPLRPPAGLQDGKGWGDLHSSSL